MDDLMRRAAADYPVKPQGMNWEKVAQQLADTAPEPPSNQHGGLKKLLLLLPFLLGSFVCDRFLQYEYGHLKKLESAKQANSLSNQPNTKNVIQKAEPVNTVQIAKENTTVVGSHQPRINELVFQKNGRPTLRTTSQRNEVLNQSVAAIKSAGSIEDELTNDRQTGVSLSRMFPDSDPKNAAAIVPQNLSRLKLDLMQPKVARKKAEKGNNAATHKAYVSLLFGPDVSRVKAQQTEPSGYSVGAVGGYQFSKRWAVETGVLWDRKNYYSTGKYFKTSKIPLPSGSTVMEVNGYCAMFEIPVNLRFTALQKSRSGLFVSAGLSSYLMHNENYDYVVQRWGTNYRGNADYKHASKNWFSVANLSLGYEHKLGSKINIHIEPYFKIPISGVGIGSLPLSSKGVLLGLTYPIH